ncbi:MAG: carboxypeptidase-like regulatory domain-containing protein, partial [Bryobacteraceae bacterium]
MTDPSGAPVVAAKVTASSPALLVPQSTLTGSEGGYRFPSLAPGTYEVTVEAPGFAPLQRENIIITSGFNATIDAPLALAGQAQTVAVTAEAPLIDVENTKLQNVFSAAVLKDIPTARDMWSLIGISPGLAVKSFDVGGSATGTQIPYYAYGMTGQQRVQEDGVNMTEGNSATSAYGDYSAFTEVQMGTSGNDASMPSPGAQINFIVKSGGNMFHGDFYQDYENPDFQGHNISQTQLDEGAGQGTRITTYHDTNGDVGGPIMKDKLWFFTAARYQTIGTTVTGYPVNNPSSGPAFTTTLSDALYKVTYQINDRNRISQMLNFDRKEQPYRNASNTQYSDAVYNEDLVEWIGNVVWDSTISNRAFLEVRLGSWGYNWTNQSYNGSDGGLDYR